MADYPKFTWDEYHPEYPERFKTQLERQFGCVFADYPNPSMSFERFKEMWDKGRSIMSIDEPTHIKQRLKGSINPAEEPLWIKAFKEWIKGRQLWQ